LSKSNVWKNIVKQGKKKISIYVKEYKNGKEEGFYIFCGDRMAIFLYDRNSV